MKKCKTQANFNRLIEEKKIFNVSFGLYSDDINELGDLEVVFLRYLNATLTNESAFAYYDLTEFVPEKYVISTGINDHTINFDYVKQVYMSETMSKIGREKIKTDSGYIYIYNKERMLIELFRLKTKFAPELFSEVVRSYRNLVINNDIDFLKFPSTPNILHMVIQY